MPRLNKADNETVEEFGFEFVSAAPEKDNTRRSKYDDAWEAARELCRKFPGQTLRVRTYNNRSSAYADAKKINNGEKRLFKNDAQDWKAVAAPTTDLEDTYEDGSLVQAVYLTYIGAVEE